MRRPVTEYVSHGLKNPQEVSKFVKRQIKYIVHGPAIYANNKLGIGHNIFDSEWDLMIILDSCTPEAIRELDEEYDFINEVHEKRSVGGRTGEWMANTFVEDKAKQIQETTYVTSSPTAVRVLENRLKKDAEGGQMHKRAHYALKNYFPGSVVHINQLDNYFGFFKHTVNTNNGECVGNRTSARAVTNKAINLSRNQDIDRLLLHYMPPHRGYFATREDNGKMADANVLYENINILNEPRKDTWDAYLDNLRWALEEVQIILNNVDAEKVIITADHGADNFTKLKGFPATLRMERRQVPWIITSAQDQKTFLPNENWLENLSGKGVPQKTRHG